VGIQFGFYFAFFVGRLALYALDNEIFFVTQKVSLRLFNFLM